MTAVRGSVTNLEIIIRVRRAPDILPVTYQVLADADVGVTCERISAAKVL